MTDKEELTRGDALARVAVLEAENAELRKRACVPEGWMVVPSQCTSQMEDAYDQQCADDNAYGCSMHLPAYEAMLAAAPAPVERATDKESLSVDQLWAVHAQGPDELYPAFNRDDAEKHAAALNALSANCDIKVSAVVVESPWPPVDHWKYLAEQEREHAEQFVDVDAIFPKAAPFERVEQEAGLYAVKFLDNWDGELNCYWLIARLDDKGEWLSEESGKSLLQYEGDKILSAIRLDTTQPAPTAAQDVAGLVEALETCRHWFEQNSPAAPLITGDHATHPMLAMIRKTLAAHQQREGE